MVGQPSGNAGDPDNANPGNKALMINEPKKQRA